MTNSKTNSKANNTLTTKKSTMPEQQLKRAFEPKVSLKDGLARLTYAGYKHSISKFGKPFLMPIFTVVAIDESKQQIGIPTSYSYGKTNKLGRLLAAMGWIGETSQNVVDEDDEFGYEVTDNTEEIYDFLDEQKGLVFKAKCYIPEGKNLYDIDIDSIIPFLDNTGKQRRDYDASEGIGNEMLSIDLEASGDND